MEVCKEDDNTSAEPKDSYEEITAQNASPQPTYRSFKKKFRKIKLKFDEIMLQNKELYFDEQRAIQTAKRLALQNDRILDILYDVNNSSHIPAEKRIDLATETPLLDTIPPFISDDELSKVRSIDSPEGKQSYGEIQELIAARNAVTPPKSPVKSLAFLLTTTSHLKSNNPHIPSDLLASLNNEDGKPALYSYLVPDNINENNYEIESTRGDIPAAPRSQPSEPYQDPVFGNLHSPYNWLRRHVPQIFLQDGECSEKSSGKPGALRGAGKRANVPVPSKLDSLEIVEEDGLSYDFAVGSAKDREKKRKREDEDLGKKTTNDENKSKKPRQARKKKGEGLDDKTTSVSVKKSKKPKIQSPPPDAHPFGPA
ncbi:BgTH12-00695 [Blumeria graminis f. sp. triticale]|uniref:BgTH12-00695 n=1 Tax=Blumeria graminis f. sp. triticale TaxID=1689686 RepID=A0A9W4D6X3_BLUGR|nr:BgTH12-00695 [Blumeria graminis f. sp. triticale]